jgi:hypothetical protein
MTIPGFNAEASLVKTSSQYRSAGARFHHNGGSAESQITACYLSDGCPPGYSLRCIGDGWYSECRCFRHYVIEPTPPGSL